MSNVETFSGGEEASGDSCDKARSADVSRGASESRGTSDESRNASEKNRGDDAWNESRGVSESHGGSGAAGESRGARNESRGGIGPRGVSEARASVESFAPGIAPSVGGGVAPIGAGEGAARGGGSGRRRPLPPKLYRIGEVVAYSGVSRQTIHNYTTMGLLQESRWTEGGHRLYDESVFDRLDRIGDLKSHHKSLREIRDHFDQSDRQDG